MTATHDKISPTAKFVAQLRTFTDIPYSGEIAEACHASSVLTQLFGDTDADINWLAPVIEQRYKSVDAALCLQDTQHVIEFASGVSPRGLIWSASNEGTFIETDLSGILEEKKAVVTGILKSERPNLHLDALNVVHDDATTVVATHITNGRIAVINEGLLPYLDHKEKEAVARNVHSLLSKFGGVWITPDIMSSKQRIKELMNRDPQIGKMLQIFSGATDRNMEANSFESENEAISFFRAIGFKVEVVSQSDLVPQENLSSMLRVDCTDMLEAMLGRGKVCIMRL